MGVVTLADPERINTAGGETHFLGFSWSGRLGEPVAALPREPYLTGFLSGACLAIRREAWDAVGGLPGHFFLYCEDVDLSHRLRLSGRAFGVVPAARVTHDYVFDKGAYKWRRLERNRWVMVLRTYPGPLLALVLPALLACEPALLLVALRGGWGASKLRAWLDLLAWLPRMLAERRGVQALATVSPSAFAAGLRAGLDSELFGGLGRSRMVRAALAAPTGGWSRRCWRGGADRRAQPRLDLLGGGRPRARRRRPVRAGRAPARAQRRGRRAARSIASASACGVGAARARAAARAPNAARVLGRVELDGGQAAGEHLLGDQRVVGQRQHHADRRLRVGARRAPRRRGRRGARRRRAPAGGCGSPNSATSTSGRRRLSSASASRPSGTARRGVAARA